MENVLSFIQLISLIVIVGGTITIGALAAPIMFKNLSREEAGMLMIELFSKFDNWIKVSAVLLLGAKLTEIIVINKMNFMIETSAGEELTKSLNTTLVTNSILILIIVAISFYLSMKLSPAITSSYQNDSPEFSQLHKRSEALHKVNFILGLILLFSFA